MAKSKTKRAGTEYDVVDRFKHENAKLKRENAKLRKLIQRADLSRLNHLEELIDEQRKCDKEIKSNKDKAREKWLCHDCGGGYMMPRIFKRRDGDFYYRTCNNEDCGNSTRMKKLHPKVDLTLLKREIDE